MTPMQILNQLYADKKISLSFQDEKSREQFRQRLYKIKKGQDVAVTDILEEEKLVLRAKKEEKYDAFKGEVQEFILRLWMEEAKKPNYQVLSIEENDGRAEKEVSGDLGKTSPERSDGSL